MEREKNAERIDCIYNVGQTLASKFHHRKPHPWIIKERSTRAGADVKVGSGVGGNPNTELNPRLGKRGGPLLPARRGRPAEFRLVALSHPAPVPDLIRSGTYRRVS